MSKKSARIVVVMEPELKEAIRDASTKLGVQMNDFVRMSVIRYLRELGHEVDVKKSQR